MAQPDAQPTDAPRRHPARRIAGGALATVRFAGATAAAVLLAGAGSLGVFLMVQSAEALDTFDPPTEAAATIVAGMFIGGCVLVVGALVGLLLYFRSWRL